MKAGFIGLGQMGAGMAASLLAAGQEVAVFNRTPARAAPLVERGATAAATVSEACRGEAVVTMLSDDAALESVVYGQGGVLASLPAGAVHVSSSTISVEFGKRLAADHAAAGQRFVSAPVFGRPDRAATGQLFVVAAGAPDAIEAAQPLFDAIGARTFVVAEAPDAANLVKLSGNFLIGSVIESVGEAMALVAKGGVDRHQYVEILTSTLFGAPVYAGYGALIADGKYEPAGFAVPLGYKDIGLALAAANDLKVPMPLASLLRDRLLRLLAGGGESLDWAAMARLSEDDAATSRQPGS